MIAEKRMQVEQLLAATSLSTIEIAERTGTSRSAVDRVRQTLKRQGTNPERPPLTPSVTTDPDGSKQIVTDALAASPGAPWKPADLLKAHGLNPDDWMVVRAVANRWGNPEEPMHQFKIWVVPVEALIKLAQPTEWGSEIAPAPELEFGQDNIVFVADQHYPRNDKGLHACILQFLHDEEPSRAIGLGDSADFTILSKHRERRGLVEAVNATLQGVHDMYADYRKASPDTQWEVLPGNHDFRIEALAIDKLGVEWASFTAANQDVPALNLRRLFDFDGIGVKFIDEDWDKAKIHVTDSLTARHGEFLGPNSEVKMLDKYSRSQIYGHGHRAAQRFRTRHDPTDTRVAIMCPTAAEIEEGLGYASEPDWQQGIVSGWTWDDGDFALSIAPYVAGKLLVPDGRRYIA